MLTLSQTGLHIPISDGLNYQVYFNNSVDDSFLTHLDLRVKLNAILANMKFNASNQNILYLILTPQYFNLVPNFIPDNYGILAKLINIPMKSNMFNSTLVSFQLSKTIPSSTSKMYHENTPRMKIILEKGNLFFYAITSHILNLIARLMLPTTTLICPLMQRIGILRQKFFCYKIIQPSTTCIKIIQCKDTQVILINYITNITFIISVKL